MLLRRIKQISLLIISIMCTKVNNESIYYYNYEIINYIDVIPRPRNDLRLVIDKISLDVYTTYDTSLKEGLEIYDKTSRLSDNKSTLIIMGHTGFGKNVFFNRLYKLIVGDEITVIYNGKTYIYIIEKIEVINKFTSYPFEYDNNNLYLITCQGRKKQLIIKAKMT